MKIGILTQPLANNYGGLLQAYALQSTLERLGHDVIILNRPMIPKKESQVQSIKRKVIVFLKNCIKTILHRPITVIYHELTEDQYRVVNRYTDLFIRRFLHKSPDLFSTEALASFSKELGIEAFVVGSDQCWRPMYSPCLSNYFLDFAKGWRVRRIAYAASFGVDFWEYTPKETALCSSLAQLFDAISVRESSGINLCHDHLGVNAVHLVDPTLLLSAADYRELFEDSRSSFDDIPAEHRLPNIHSVEGKKMFCYVLDMNPDKEKLIDVISEAHGLIPVYCMPKKYRAQEIFQISPDDCTYPPVELWLQSFNESGFVITDSFHGTVFSIIFNKPFYVLKNPGRGMARLLSLLMDFGLENRMIQGDKYGDIDTSSPINWKEVNQKWEQLKIKSYDFLKAFL